MKVVMGRQTREPLAVSTRRHRFLRFCMVIVATSTLTVGVAAAQTSSQIDTCGGPLLIVRDDELPSNVRGFDANGLIGTGSIWTSPRSLTTKPWRNDSSGEYRLKMPWFRTKPGRLKLTGKRIDGAGRFRAETAKPGEYAPTGFEPSVLMFSTEGCWKITAHHRDSTYALYIQVGANT
jgi:hypothetical protein